MARTLKTKLDLETGAAKRNADKVKESLRDVGKEGERAGRQTTGEFSKAAQATRQMEQSVLALGASYLSLTALISGVKEIVRAYEDAIRLRGQFAGGAAAMQGVVAGAGAQFGIEEPVMARFVGQLAKQIGAGPESFNALQQMITSAASAKLIGELRQEKGEVQIDPQDYAKLAGLGQFAQYVGRPEAAPDLAKLMRKGMGTKTDAGTFMKVMGQTVAAYRESQVSEWGEFITGAVAGTSTLLEQGVSYPTAISRYAALAKMERSGVRAGETIRMLGERFFVGDDPKIVRLLDRQYGPGTYWKLKREDPDRLFAVILQALTAPTGEERAKLFAQVNIPIEQGGRLARLAGAGGEVSTIEQRMRGVQPETMAGELSRWRGGQRAVQQAGATEAALIGVRAGTGPEQARLKALTDIAEAEVAREKEESPFLTWIEDVSRTDASMRNMGLTIRLLEEQKKRGWDTKALRRNWIRVDISGRELDIYTPWRHRHRLTDEERQLERERLETIIDEMLVPPQPTTQPGTPVSMINIGTFYGTRPTDVTQNTFSRFG